MRHLLVLALLGLLALALPVQALAADPPWAGGTSVISPLEQKLNMATTDLAKRTGYGHCPTPDEWLSFSRTYDFPPNAVYGFVPVGSDAAFYNPAVCTALDRLVQQPGRDGTKACQVGTRTEYRLETRTEYRAETRVEYYTKYQAKRYRVTVKKRVKVRGKWRTKRVRVWRVRRTPIRASRQVHVQVPYEVQVQVAHEIPVIDTCATYASTVESVATVAHESMHVGGVHDEPAAECFGLQLTARTAHLLGASGQFAFEMGADYLPIYANFVQSSPSYFSPNCFDGGSLDLWPSLSGWPTPQAAARSSAESPRPAAYSPWRPSTDGAYIDYVPDGVTLSIV